MEVGNESGKGRTLRLLLIVAIKRPFIILKKF
jgi:hypothetical protein